MKTDVNERIREIGALSRVQVVEAYQYMQQTDPTVAAMVAFGASPEKVAMVLCVLLHEAREQAITLVESRLPTIIVPVPDQPPVPDLPFGVDDVVQQAGGERGKVLGIHVLTERDAERQSEKYGIPRKPGVYASVHLWGIPTKDGATGRIGTAVIPVGDLVKVDDG